MNRYDELYYELIRLKDTFLKVDNYVQKQLKADVSF